MRKILAWALAFTFASLPVSSWAAQPVSLYDFTGAGITSTSLGGGHTGLDISGTISSSSPSVGLTGSSVPTSADFIGAKNGSGNLVGLLTGQQTMANSLACVLPSDQSAIPVTGTFWQSTQPVSVSSLPLPTGASTSALQTTGNTTLSTISGQLPTALDGSGFLKVHEQGTAAISAAALPLPTGASTSALQTTGNTALTTINTTLGSPFQAGGSIGNSSFGISGTLPAYAAIPTFKIDQTTPGTTNGVQVNAALPAGTNLIGKVGIDQTTVGTTNAVSLAQIGTTTVVTGTGASTAGSQRVTVANDSKVLIWDGTNTAAVKAASTAAVATDPAQVVAISPNSVAPKTYPNSAGTFVLNASLTTVVSETCPSGGVGFLLEASSSNSANIRWALGATATTSSGMRLEPGRDTVFVPVCATISIVAESGTQEYELTWVKQ